VHLPFNFQLVDASWEARSLATLIANYEAALPPGGWPNWVLGNHDRPRVAAKRGQAQARVAAMLLLTLRGTPTLYYGDELGLSDVAIPPAQVQDPRGLREPGSPWAAIRSAHRCRGTGARMPASPRQAVAAAQCRLADAQRRADGGGASFNPDALSSVAGCQARASGAVDRDFGLLDAEGDVLAYERRHGAERLIVALNLGGRSHRLELPDWASDCRPLLSTVADAALAGDGTLLLRADEGVILTAD